MLATVFSLRARMNFALREHRRLRAEALDDAAHERPDVGGGDQHRGLALARGLLELLAHQSDEFRQLGGLHGEMALVAFADHALGEGLLPFRRQRDQRQVAALARCTARRSGATAARARARPASPDCACRRCRRRCLPGWWRDRGSRRARPAAICSTRWMPETVISEGTRSLTSSACSLGSSLSSFCTSA